jgi:N-acyl-D-amino-acid deacylase
VIGVVSHMKALGPASWGLSKTLIANIEAARKRGVQVFADQYPYEASGTGIVGALMPRSAQVGGREAMMKRITGELRPEIREQVKTNIARRGGADTLMISRYSANPSFEGQRLSRRARRIRAATAREGRREPRLLQHVGGRHREHHETALDDDVH